MVKVGQPLSFFGYTNGFPRLEKYRHGECMGVCSGVNGYHVDCAGVGTVVNIPIHLISSARHDITPGFFLVPINNSKVKCWRVLQKRTRRCVCLIMDVQDDLVKVKVV